MGKLISLDAAINELATLIYPGDSIRSAKKAIRNAVDYAREKKKLFVHSNAPNGPLVDQTQIHHWAAEKWPSECGHLGPPNTGHVNVTLPSLSASAFGTAIPTENADIEFSALAYAHFETCEQLKNASAENAELKSQLDAYKEKEEITRRRQSAAGKKGGRGNFGSI